MLRDLVKLLAHVVATVLVAPCIASFWVRSSVLGRNRALEGSTQVLSLIPGLPGQYLRRAFLCAILRRCHRSATIEFGTIFSEVGARIDERVYVGPRCHLGLVHLECDVLLAAGVHVPSGRHTHASRDVEVPIREQGGSRTIVRIGAGAWVGSTAVVMADVGRGAIVGAGAVVTRPMPDGVVAAGVPARVLSVRPGWPAIPAGNAP